MLAWSEDICKNLANHGFFVIRFDNRDIGLSTKFEDAGLPDFVEISAAYARGDKPKVPYSLEDMAGDCIGILDELDIDKVHVFGASMGGMIAQIIAYKYPSRIKSLTLVMSTTGNPDLPQPKSEIMAQFFAPVPSEREAYIEEMVKRDSLIYGTLDYDENQSRDYRTKEYDRSYYPEGIARQLAAMAVPGNLKPNLNAIKAPTLVIHGKEDPFNSVEASKDIASAIPGAELLILDGMGHSFPHEVLPRIIDALVVNSNKKDT
ncbi:MAG: alpha/beta hydrolase [Candidatus Lokiarchaeota archaeon]|nr:alpha/beta hydrolase [Candidatus Lokiarchaeota archaeon]